MKKTIQYLALAAVAVTSMATSAMAQNPNYDPGDLILFFRTPDANIGDNQTYVNLGNVGSVVYPLKGTTTLNITNIDTELSEYGANWYDLTTLYGGIAGANAGSNLSSVLTNGDPTNTVYVSQQRTTAAGLGTPQAPFTLSSTLLAGTATNILTSQAGFEAGSVLSQETIAIAAGTNNIPGQVPIAGNSFTNVPSVLQQGSASNFGTVGGVANVEFMWDLFRVQRRDNIDGQNGFGLGTGTGEYLGTIVLSQDGNVSLVPEPTTGLLVLVAGALGLVARRRRA